MKNILTFDIEEYFHVENFRQDITPDTWDSYESRVQVGVDAILALLTKHNATATFFVLGWIAERHPAVIEKIADAGHEIGSHGYAHQLIYTQTPDEFRADLKRSIDVISGVTGKPVESYRAPCFSITEQSLWALDILLECGIRYDSSIFPIRHHRYGIPSAEPFPHVIREKDGQALIEFPISTYSFLGKRLPFSGGGYFRLLPARLMSSMARQITDKGNPLTIYLHPWEFDHKQPKVQSNVFNQFRHYVNIKHTHKKLAYCLEHFSFGSMHDYVQATHYVFEPKAARSISSRTGSVDLSIVIPIYNEEECAEMLYAKVKTALQHIGHSYEIILIDDGSKDRTPQIVKELQAQHDDLRVIRFRKNYGQTPAMVAGFDYARGAVIITMDGDLQNDPADIPKLLEKMAEGYEVVSGWRYKRQDTLITRKIPSMIANRLISLLTGVRLHDYGCSLKAYKAECITAVHAYAEMHRFFPAVASITGARTAEIPVNHYARTLGKSKYGLSRTFKVFADLFTIFMITKFSTRPSVLFGLCSLPFIVMGLVIGVFALYQNIYQGISLIVLPGAAMLCIILGSHFIVLALLSMLVLKKGDLKPSQLSVLTAEAV